MSTPTTTKTERSCSTCEGTGREYVEGEHESCGRCAGTGVLLICANESCDGEGIVTDRTDGVCDDCGGGE